MGLRKLAAQQRDPSTRLQHRCPKTNFWEGRVFKTGRTTSGAAGPDVSTSRVSELKLLRTLFVFLVVVWALSSYLCMQISVCRSRRVIGWCFPDFLQIGWWSREGPNLNRQDGGAQRDLHPPYGHLLLEPPVDFRRVSERWERTGVSVSFPPAFRCLRQASLWFSCLTWSRLFLILFVIYLGLSSRWRYILISIFLYLCKEMLICSWMSCRSSNSGYFLLGNWWFPHRLGIFLLLFLSPTDAFLFG